MERIQQKPQSIELSLLFENRRQNTFDYRFCSETKAIFMWIVTIALKQERKSFRLRILFAHNDGDSFNLE